jgi:SAM-dependent methyltransferase
VTLFPLDEVKHARINQDFELLLEDVREDIASFTFGGDFEREDVLAAYDMARPRLNVLLSALRDMKGASGADISTGAGFLPVLLRRQGIGVVATEKETAMSEFAVAAGVEVREYCIGRDRPPFASSSLDFLIFAEVLEHLKLSPLPVMRELAALLRPGGRLVVTTPNIARLHHLETLAAGENFLEPFPNDLPLDLDATNFVEHVREYSVREVADAVEGAGLVVESIRMTGWGESGYEPLSNPYAAEIIVVVAVSH